MLDFFSWISWMVLTELAAIILFVAAFLIVPFFSKRFFYGHLSSREILTNIVICGSLILPFLLTFNIFYSFIQHAFIDVFGSDVIDMFTYGRVGISIVLFFLYGLWTVISGVLNKDQRFYWFTPW